VFTFYFQSENVIIFVTSINLECVLQNVLGQSNCSFRSNVSEHPDVEKFRIEEKTMEKGVLHKVISTLL